MNEKSLLEEAVMLLRAGWATPEAVAEFLAHYEAGHQTEQPDYEIGLLLFEDTPGFGYLIFPAPDGVRYVGVNVTGEGFFFPLTGFVIYKTEEEAREYQALLVAQHKKEQAAIIVPKLRPIAVEKLPADIRKIIARETRRRRDD